jgi:hypothetical protein
VQQGSFFERHDDLAKEAAHHRGVGFDPALGRKAIAEDLKRDVRFLDPRSLKESRGAASGAMAAMPDRLPRAIPFNSLEPFDRRRFADLVAARCCAAAHLAPLHHQSPGHASLANTALPSPAGLRESQQVEAKPR